MVNTKSGLNLNVLLLSLAISFFSLNVYATQSEKTMLTSEQAFKVTANLNKDKKSANIDFKIADGYLLYQEHFQFKTNEGKDFTSQMTLPNGIKKLDEDLGESWIYKKDVKATVPLSAFGSETPEGLRVRYQGCAEAGFCYPPQFVEINFDEKGSGVVTPISEEEFSETSNEASAASSQNPSELDSIVNLFSQKNLFLTLLAFLGFGLLLSFTPCVLPMVPILASILVGQKSMTKKRTMVLATAYVMSVSLCYAAAGIAAGFLGQHLQIVLQQPLFIVILSFALLLFALSQFNFIQIQVPAFVSAAFSRFQPKERGGSVIGAVSMGVVSALMLSPCVTPALIGALTYIAQTKDVVFGGLALFTLALGMGLPLLIFALVGSHFLPKAGAWMNRIKYVTGGLLCALSISLLFRAVPLNASETVVKAEAHPIFTSIHTATELNQALKTAQTLKQPVLLDVYADWCVSCKEMDREVFQNPSVVSSLQDLKVLRLDLTSQTPDKVALQKSLNIIGPPMILFFDHNGAEVTSYRAAGKLKYEDFIGRLSHFMDHLQDS